MRAGSRWLRPGPESAAVSAPTPGLRRVLRAPRGRSILTASLVLLSGAGNRLIKGPSFPFIFVSSAVNCYRLFFAKF